MRTLAVLTVRNEGAFLLEWLAHHQAIGFTDFLVFSNDCQDGTDTMLDRLHELGHLTHIRNDGDHEGGIQWAALKQADKHPLVKNADWILPLDIDEFVNIQTGDGDLSSLYAALPEATAITLTWRMFGNDGVVHYKDAPVTAQFTKAAPDVTLWPWRLNMFKTLYRNDGTYRKLGVHRPRNPDNARIDAAKWFDGAGRALPQSFATKRIFSDMGRNNFGLVQLNHYPLGSMESYLLKCDRGRAVHSDDRLGMDYWVERNLNTHTDDSILQTSAKRRAKLAGLQSDSVLMQLHDAAATWRKQKFDSLMAEEPMRALFARLLTTPTSIPLDKHASGLLFAHAQRAHVNKT